MVEVVHVRHEYTLLLTISKYAKASRVNTLEGPGQRFVLEFGRYLQRLTIDLKLQVCKQCGEDIPACHKSREPYLVSLLHMCQYILK